MHEPDRKDFRMWHRGRDPDAVFSDEVEFPDQVPQIGVVLEICYWSDKFARRCRECNSLTEEKRCKCGGITDVSVGDFELYRHDCDSKAPVYAPSSTPDDSEKFMEVVRGAGRITVTQLAFMADITMKLNNGSKVVQGFSFSGNEGTPLYCMQDRKTLIIPWSRRPMIVTGSKMRITKHGIIH